MTTEFEDITKDFEAAAHDMIIGEYLSDGQYFSLNSAMYATDSGDPQLDPAYDCTKILIGNEHLVGPTPSISLPDKRLDPRLIIGAMDRALSAFGAWNAGLGSGLHTIYSCVYFQLPENAITSAWLKPFIQGIVSLHDFLIPYIKMSSIVKSEDACALDCKQFNDRDIANKHLPQAEQRKCAAELASPEHAKQVMKCIDDALAILPPAIKTENENSENNTTKPKQDSLFYGTADKDVEEKVPEDMRLKVAEAISARLLFVRQLLEMHTSLDECNVVQACKATQLCVEKILPKITETLALGAEEPKGSFNSESWRRARSAIFVRPFKFPSVEEALKIFKDQLDDIIEICNVASLDVCDYLSLFHWVKCFMFAQKERNVFARIWLSHLLKLTEKWLKRSSPMLTAGSFNIIPIPKAIADHDNAMSIEARIAMAWEETIDTFLMNKARLFRKLPDIFNKWDEMGIEAASVDREFLKTFPMDAPELASNVRKGLFFFMYILHVKLMLIVEYLTCGLAIDVYLEHEYRYILWYSEYIMGIAQTCILDATAQFNVFEKLYTKKTKKSKTDKKWSLYRELYSDYVNAYLSSIRGLVRMICAILRDGLITEPNFPYGRKETTYQFRLKSIHKLSVPSPVEYRTFHENTNFHKFKSEMLYKAATAEFANAKEILQACNKKVLPPVKAPLFFTHDNTMKWLRMIATNLIDAKIIPDAFNKDRKEYKKKNKIVFRYNVYSFLPAIVAEKITEEKK